MYVTAKNPTSGLTIKAYQGDAKTMLAFNLPKAATKKLAGFTIAYQADGIGPYYLSNNLRFQDPTAHAQDRSFPPTASINAPIHKFRWIHVPGGLHQGATPYYGDYTYTVTPRYFDASSSLLPIDPKLGAAVVVPVGPFKKQGVSLGFARGFTQSQAFTHHFGPKPVVRPPDFEYDTAAQAGVDPQGNPYTYLQEYEWLGFTARTQVFDLLQEVIDDSSLWLDVFAYDLNEPDFANLLLKLAGQGRIRVILDNAALHHNKAGTTPEDQFEALFDQAAKGDAKLLRGHFARYAHDKELIVSERSGTGAKATLTPVKVLTGSTNFSVTGMYVNSNHVVIFDDAQVAAAYAEVFNACWAANMWDGRSSNKFAGFPEAAKTYAFGSKNVPTTEVTYSPHDEAMASQVLQGIADRIAQEGQTKGGSVLFAVMDIGTGSGPVFPALRDIHDNQAIFSYGITDTTSGIELYKPGSTEGVLVTGKPAKSVLPPPFDQIPSIGGVGHQVHHKFVVCGFNSPNAVVYCGSSNLALGGEQANGDNLIAIHDTDLATAFAIEAVGLVDHFDFLDRVATNATASGTVPKKTDRATTLTLTRSTSKQHQAEQAEWYLSTTDGWTARYYNPKDLRCVDRELFA